MSEVVLLVGTGLLFIANWADAEKWIVSLLRRIQREQRKL